MFATYSQRADKIDLFLFCILACRHAVQFLPEHVVKCANVMSKKNAFEGKSILIM